MITKVDPNLVLKVAAKFELLALAEEVTDTGLTATSINGVVAPIITGMTQQFLAAIQNAANKAATSNQTLSGTFGIEGYNLNARAINSRWKLLPGSGLVAKGNLLQDPFAGPALKKILDQANARIAAGLENSLSRQQIKGDTMSAGNHGTVAEYLPTISI